MADYIEVKCCPLCGDENNDTDFRRGHYTGKKCSKCKLVFISPIAAEPGKIYTNDVTSSPSKYYLTSGEFDTKTFENRLNIIEHYTHKGNFLDIGCSVGNFLEIAQRKGWHATGIEPNPIAAGICRGKMLNVEEEFLNEKLVSKYQKNFDAIYAGDVIEHVENPVGFMDMAIKMLKKSGILMVVTPNYNSIIAKIFQIKPEEHILYFNIPSLKFLVHKMTVKTELINTTTRMRNLRALEFSTTFANKPFQKKILKILYSAGLETVINFIIKIFVRDEIILVIRKL